MAAPDSRASAVGRTPAADAPELSVVLPVFDERDNLGALYREIRDALEGRAWELCVMDDGSRDGSVEVARRIAAGDGRVRVFAYGGGGEGAGENRGQTAAMLAGIRVARAPLVVTMDADGQNDPRDVPKLLDALGDRAAAIGVRTKRRDGFVRRASSRVANAVRNRLTGDRVTDTGCSLKLFRREAALEVPPFHGMHRFLPTLLRQAGHEVVEVAVNHRPRRGGVSKYGIGNRLVPATVDLLAVCWMRRRRRRLDDVREVGPEGELRRPEPASAPATATATAAERAERRQLSSGS